MQTIRLLFCALLLFSFFLGDEKELRHLAKSGQKELDECHFLTAKELFQSFYKRCKGEKGMLSWQEYIEYILSFARTLEMLGEVQEATELLSSLMRERPPEDYLPRIKLTEARLLSHQSSPEKAFLEMQALTKYLPLERWSKEDLSFFHALSYSLDEYFDALLKKAKSYYVTGFFEEAKTMYEEVLQALLGGYFPKAMKNQDLLEKKVRYSLAECLYSLAQYENTLRLVTPEGNDTLDKEMIYLMALCFQKQNEYEKAALCFQNYVDNQDPGPHYDHALFEIGYLAYTNGNFEKAHTYFHKLLSLPHFSKSQWVGALYESRMLLQEKKYEEVEKLLTSLHPQNLQEDPLKYELYYLLAEASFLKGEYKKAKELYLLSFPPKEGCSWQMLAHCRIGLCHLHLQEFAKAEKIFQALLESDQKEAACFALAENYILSKQPQALEKIEALFAGKTLSLEKEHELLLLKASAAPSYEKRKQFYAMAIDSRYGHLPTYGEGWLRQGLAEFERGQAEPSHAAACFGRAAKSFEKALSLCKEEMSHEILRLVARARFYEGEKESALALIETLLGSLCENTPEHEETLYLRALLASEERFFQELLTLYPTGNYTKEALYSLGSLSFSQEKFGEALPYFLLLAEKYPQSTHAAEGWFWAAECEEKIDPLSPKISSWRRKVYQSYPESELAPKAYFRLYPYAEYVAGNPDAMQHLAQFPKLFENHPLCIPAYYLLAMQEENFDQAEEEFRQAISLFYKASEEDILPDPTTIYYYYEAMHKLACLYMKEKKPLDKAISLLKQIASDFEEENHPFTSQLPPNQIADQARYTLAKAYLESNLQNKAEQIFLSLLSRYREQGVQEGLYLALTWKEQGKLAAAAGDYETAISCYTFADEAGAYFLSDEQKLSLWLLKSDSYRALKDYPAAMRMLSKVINADVVSPMRVKAMYLRAEIYELEERYDLAARQLDALSKKGGEWAILAKKKLKESYGVE